MTKKEYNLPEAENKLVSQLMEEITDVLKENNIMMMRYPVFGMETDEKQKKKRTIKKFIESQIEETENEKDIISTHDLWEQYDDWNRVEGSGQETMLNSTYEMGMYMKNLGYEKGRMKKYGKEITGYKRLRYKDNNQEKMKKFLEERTERTESSEDRIALDKVVHKYKEHTGDKYINREMVLERLRREGMYIKACLEKAYYIREHDQKKIRLSESPMRQKEQCVMKLKWKE